MQKTVESGYQIGNRIEDIRHWPDTGQLENTGEAGEKYNTTFQNSTQ